MINSNWEDSSVPGAVASGFDGLAETLGDGLLGAYLLGIDQVTRETAEFADPLKSGFDIPPAEAIEYFQSKRVVTRKEFRRLAGEARGAAFSVAGVYRDDLLEGFKEEISRALQEGTPQQKTVKRFREILSGKKGHRRLGAFHLENVFRTNMQMSYGVGRRRGLESVAEDLPYWTYHTAGDDRVRDNHRALNGITLRHDHEFWNDHYPPWDFACRCSVTAGAREPEGYDPKRPGGDAEIFYDDRGIPAKAEIETRVVDLAVGDFKGVPRQSGLRETIEAGVDRAKRKRIRR